MCCYPSPEPNNPLPNPKRGIDDFRLFCGDLGNDVTDEVLANAFRHKYPSFAKAKVRPSVRLLCCVV